MSKKVLKIIPVPVKSELSKVLSFIQSAVTTDGTRYFMTVMVYEFDERTIIATDGHRLHLVRLGLGMVKFLVENGITESVKLTYEKGFLTVYAYNDPDLGTYPQWKKVVPTDYVSPNVMNIEDESGYRKIHLDLTSKKMFSRRVSLISAYTQSIINIDYLADLIGYDWTVGVNKDVEKRRSTVTMFTVDLGDSAELLAVIMPMAGFKEYECDSYHDSFPFHL